MSFMFHPHPYDDPNAVNPVPMPEAVRKGLVTGLPQVAKAIARAAEDGKRIIGLDMYPGAQAEALVRLLQQALPGLACVDTRTMALPPEELAEKLNPCLPMDRKEDPVLLYGVRFEGTYEDLFDGAKLQGLAAQLKDARAPVLVYGPGALCDALRDRYDLRIWLDITPKQAVLNFKNGLCANFGSDRALPYGQMMRRNYYVDFELGLALRWSLIRRRAIDLYISGSNPQAMQMLPFSALEALFEELNSRPFRCRPVYLAGVWGGQYIKRLRRVPDAVRNCAWVFDLIPMEVSLVADMDGLQFETPFYTFVQTMGERLLGQKAFDDFGGYFPIRFNYDDTYHAAGNMSIQVHPDEAYVRAHNRELGRQDESYYIVVAGQGAKTYAGFQNDADVGQFIREVKRSEADSTPIDHDAYVHSTPSKPGMQFLIPAGTIHASGRNQVILEIGSLTVGSYTYKLYDYLRTDLDGNRRPIHSLHGERVLRRDYKADWVHENLIQAPRVVRETEEGRELIVGEHELLYFTLRNLCFARRMTDDTADRFHVLVLVEGEQVLVRSLTDPTRFFRQRYLDMVVVPAGFGPYELINEGVGEVVMHKTMLREGYEHVKR